MKKRILAISILQLLFLSGRGQVDSLTVESYTNEIYTLIFNKYIWGLQQPNFRNEKTTVVIRETPKFFNAVEDYVVNRITKKYKRVQRETFEAFKEKINDPVHFENLNIPGFYIYVFNEASFPSWSDLEENYKNWNRKFIEFTPIGFNDDFEYSPRLVQPPAHSTAGRLSYLGKFPVAPGPSKV